MLKKYNLFIIGFCVLLVLGLVIIPAHGQEADLEELLKGLGLDEGKSKDVGRGQWDNITTVDSKGKVGWYTSLALDENGNPWISYNDFSKGDLKCAKWTGKAWEIRTMDYGEPGEYLWEREGDVGKYSSLALDKNGNVWVYYYDQIYKTLKFAVWFEFDDSISWGYVDGLKGNVGEDLSFVLDKDGNQRISCHDETNGDLLYVKSVKGTWKTEVVDSKGNVGEDTSLALDKNGNPRISYFDRTNTSVKYARWTGRTWKIETVDEGNLPSLALDKNGNPRISYFDGNLKYAKWTGRAWKIEIVDSTAQYVGMYSSLALDKNGNPRISYYDYSNGDLKYAKWTGKTWKIETVDSKGDVGLHSSLALDKDGNPRISYLDETNGDLKYAWGE